MKTKIILYTKLLAFALAISSVGGCNQNNGEASQQTSLDDTLKEKNSLPLLLIISSITDSITMIPVLDYAPLDVDTGKARIIIEASTFSITLNGKGVNPLAAKLKLSHLNSFKDTVFLSTCTPCFDSLAAVRIIYGQEGEGMFLYYQPLLLCGEGEPFLNSKGLTVRNFSLCKEREIYFYTIGGGFQEVDTPEEIADKDRRIANYKVLESAPSPTYGVKIVNTTNGEFEDFKSDQDSTANVSQIVYPIDELIDLAVKTSTQEVFLWNAIIRIKFNSIDYHKHNIELSTDNVSYSSKKLSIPVEAKFSNLSHICPPRCSQFTIHVLPQ